MDSKKNEIILSESKKCMIDNTLEEKVIYGGFWVMSLRVMERLLKFARLVILARVLSPSDFGLLGIALITMSMLNTFSQTGFNAALIQKKQDTQNYLDVAWTVSVIRGILLALLIYFLAPLAGAFFNSPHSVIVIRVIGISFVLEAFTNVGVVYFIKEMNFNKQFIYSFSGTIVDFIVAVLFVFAFRNVWALVFGLLAGNTARLMMSYLVHSYRPRFLFDYEKAKGLFVFGKWIFAEHILVFLITQGDDMIVGRYLGGSTLGFYQMAYRISNLPASEITHVISNVTFPAYSKLQDNTTKLREGYLKVLRITAFFTIPLSGAIFIFATDFTKVFLGDKWSAMIPAMMVLSLAGLIRSLTAVTGPLYFARGTPHFAVTKQIFKFVVVLGSIFPLVIYWGITGAAISVVLGLLVAMIYDIVYFKYLSNFQINASRLIRDLFPILFGTILFMAAVVVLKKFLCPGILGFILMVTLSVLVYLGTNFLYGKIKRDTILLELFAILRKCTMTIGNEIKTKNNE